MTNQTDNQTATAAPEAPGRTNHRSISIEGNSMSRATYRLEVRFRDGTGHNYTKLNRAKVATLTARQFASGLDRPERITITTERQSL